MKTGFLLTDRKGNVYRVIATSMVNAINVVTIDNDIEEGEIMTIERGAPIDSVSL